LIYTHYHTFRVEKQNILRKCTSNMKKAVALPVHLQMLTDVSFDTLPLDNINIISLSIHIIFFLYHTKTH